MKYALLLIILYFVGFIYVFTCIFKYLKTLKSLQIYLEEKEPSIYKKLGEPKITFLSQPQLDKMGVNISFLMWVMKRGPESTSGESKEFVLKTRKIFLKSIISFSLLWFFGFTSIMILLTLNQQ